MSWLPKWGPSMADLIPIVSPHESQCRTGGSTGADTDCALIVNPAASLTALMAAAQSRAVLLFEQLDEWTCAPTDSETRAEKLATFLAPTAYELQALMEVMRLKVAAMEGPRHG